VPDAALVITSDVVVVGVVGGGSCDMATAMGRSGRGWRGWGLCWGAGDRSGSQCCRSEGAGGCFEVGGEAVVVVGNGIGNRDVAVTECVGVVGRDVAGVGDGGGMKTVRQGVVWDRVRGSVDVPASLSGRGGSSWDAVCVTASTVEVEVVWVAASVVS
jgi:hypothetical protein